MTRPAQSQEDIKPSHQQLMRDVEYAKSRSQMMWVSAICVFSLLLFALLLAWEKMPVEVVLVGIIACVFVYFYFIVRMTKMRNLAEIRWVSEMIGKQEKKAERKKKR